MLTEQTIMELVKLANSYALAHNLDPQIYINSMLNPDTLGDIDAKIIVDNLIKYHKDWLKKL